MVNRKKPKRDIFFWIAIAGALIFIIIGIFTVYMTIYLFIP